MEFRLPDLGEGIIEAELVQWLVSSGDAVARGEPIVEVMTDKATVELPAPFGGTITELHAEPGDQVKVGQVLLSYQAAEAEAPADEPTATAAAEPASDRRAAENLAAAPGRPAADVPPAAGSGGAGGPAAAKPSAAAAVVAAPSVRRMARQLGIDLSAVAGSGPRGRILIDDLSAHLRQSTADRSAAIERPGQTTLAPDQRRPVDGGVRPGSRIPLRGLRRMIATRMTQAKQTIPHFGYVDECDVSDLVRIRASLKQPLAERGINLTYLPFFVKAVVAALREVPLCNASLDAEAEEIVVHDHYHIGIATDTPGGLLVPVIRDADSKDVPQLAVEIEQLTAAARAGTATPEQLRGNTFTISSVGGIGGLISSPIINEPAVGILGIGKIVQRPRFDNAGQVRAADVVYLSFSFDHRVVDGAVAARLGNQIVQRLSHPAGLLV